MRKTQATIRVSIALMDDPTGQHWGYELSKRSKVRSGVLYPILHRMLEDKLLIDGWEDASEIDGKRPPRRYYELTGEGQALLAETLDEARVDSRFTGLIPRLAG